MTTDRPDSSPLRAVLLGCGDLGTRVGTALHAKGVDVTGVRRTVAALPPHIRGVAADLVAGAVPDLPADLLVITMTPDRRDPAGYRTTYVEAVRRGLDAVLRAGTPRRAVLVSSTSVYEGLEGDLDETTEVPGVRRPPGGLAAHRGGALADLGPVRGRVGGAGGRVGGWGGMPCPWSATARVSSEALRRTSTRTCWPGAEKPTAFDRRLNRIWRTRLPSATKVPTSSGTAWIDSMMSTGSPS